MEHLNFIETAKHNFPKLKRDARILVILITVCLALMGISRLFYGSYTDDYVYVNSGEHVQLGWPASVFSYSAFFAVGFALFLVLSRFKQDVRNPAFGITSQGLFINQQMLRNAFVPWNNVAHVELRGHISNPVIRVFFKDRDALVKGQSFILKSLIKPSLKANLSIGISKDEAAGDFLKMYEAIKEKGIAAHDYMEGRPKSQRPAE